MATPQHKNDEATGIISNNRSQMKLNCDKPSQSPQTMENLHVEQREDRRGYLPLPPPSLPATQNSYDNHPGKRGFSNSRKPYTLFSWWWETASAAFACLCTALIVAILFSMDGKPLENWKVRRIQPNSIVAIFSTFAKSSLLVPLAECLGQLKWIYFEKPRPVSQLQVFDEASRGPLGSAKLLWDMKGKATLASLGAILTILLLAFEPFAQQVIIFTSRVQPYHNLTGTIHQSRKWVTAWKRGFIEHKEKDLSVPVGLGIATVLGGEPYVPAPNYHCPSSDCRISDVHILGICSTCITEQISLSSFDDCKVNLSGTFTENNPRYQLRDGTIDNLYKFTSESSQLNKTETLYRFNMDMRCEKRWQSFPALQLQSRWDSGRATLEQAPSSSDTLLKAQTGNLKSESKDEVDFVNGVRNRTLKFCTYEEPGSTQPTSDFAYAMCFLSTTKLHLYNNLQKVPQINGSVSRCNMRYCAQHFVSIAIANGQKIYNGMRTGELSVVFNQSYTRDQLIGQLNWTANATGTLPYNIDGYFSSSLPAKFFSVVTHSTTTYDNAPNNFSLLFDRFSDVLTSIIQSDMNPNGSVAPLEVYGTQVFVEVRWAWMIMPLSMVLLSLLFLGLSIWSSRKDEYLLRTSILAVMCHGLDTADWKHVEMSEQVQVEMNKWETDTELDRRAKSITAVFVRDEGGHLRLKTE